MEEKVLKTNLELSCLACGDAGEIPKSNSEDEN